MLKKTAGGMAIGMATFAATYAVLRRKSGDRPAFDLAAYAPLDVLKPLAEDVWIVDAAPIEAMGLVLPVRMTVIRLDDGTLLLHSPTHFTPALAGELEGLGRVAHLIAPNVAHWTFLADWQRAYPHAITWGAPGLRTRGQVRRSEVRIDEDLGDTAPIAWSGLVDQGIVRGLGRFSEVYFFHKRSRTLVLVDMIENLDPAKLPPFTRLFSRAARATDATTALYLRPVLRGGGSEARRIIRGMIDLQPERVIFAHGQFFDTDGAARLARAFRWLI
jgi:hypothetical protein